MSDPYLILHKVRGAPAFDIAERCELGTESDPSPWWIIPTSGHRAYPAHYWPLNELCIPGEASNLYPICAEQDLTSWPDHYAANAAPPTPRLSISSILTTLGLAKPIARRKIT